MSGPSMEMTSGNVFEAGSTRITLEATADGQELVFAFNWEGQPDSVVEIQSVKLMPSENGFATLEAVVKLPVDDEFGDEGIIR